jgi:hypothetical protein
VIQSQAGTGDTKRCAKCGDVKPVSEFYRHKRYKDGIRSQCKSCHAKYKNPAKARACGKRRWDAMSADERLAKHLRYDFHTTLEWYKAELAKQDGLCAICREPNNSKHRMYVDHSHATGKNRGLLCHRCNVNLAVLEDAEWVRLASEYLDRYREAGSPPVGQ